MSVTSISHVADDDLIALLVGGASAADAASQLGVSTSTIYRRVNAPGFRDKLAAARAAQWEPAADRLRSAAGRAVEVLAELLDPEQPPATRLRAADALLRHALEYRRSAELAAQIAAMQARLDEIQQRAGDEQCDERPEAGSTPSNGASTS
ncbi:---NA--- : [Gemmataceae bacterium]|nr:---NA--- : [Gemmataceae bacterium]VTT98871.1 ---NA--- : [Gemmataceae bacterium]